MRILLDFDVDCLAFLSNRSASWIMGGLGAIAGPAAVMVACALLMRVQQD